jgi:DNA-binding MarR family transcriptional regulator
VAVELARTARSAKDAEPNAVAESVPARVPGSAPGVFDETALRRAMELLFFAYRDFTGEADALLARYGFGRAHHRVIYFVGRNPGITVSELLAILGITKQSLSRVLGQLMDGGFIDRRTDPDDRRVRRLHLTPEAAALERILTERQSALIAAATAEAGPGAAGGFVAVLRAMINPEDRRRFGDE